MSMNDDLARRLAEYAQQRDLTLIKELGAGVHGIVYLAKSQAKPLPLFPIGEQSAVKVHRREIDYVRERDVYHRLAEHHVDEILGREVPWLLDFDDKRLILEMTMVGRPFVLDFGGAYLDNPPEFSEEVWADWKLEKIEQFGDAWPEVARVLQFLEGYGIYMIDVNPGNISLPVD